jgi:uncharacterized protein (TIGR02266 family)
MADTRKDRRAPVSLKVRFKSATVDEFVEQYAMDISRGGIFIKSKSPMPIGTLLKFEFQLKDESRLIHGVGRVVWKRDGDGGVDKPPGMGIKFIKMDPQSRSLVEQIVSQRGDAPGEFEQGRSRVKSVKKTQAFFPAPLPQDQLPAPEDSTQVRHASEFLAEALSAGDEDAAREAAESAERARKRGEEISQQREEAARREKEGNLGQTGTDVSERETPVPETPPVDDGREEDAAKASPALASAKAPPVRTEEAEEAEEEEVVAEREDAEAEAEQRAREAKAAEGRKPSTPPAHAAKVSVPPEEPRSMMLPIAIGVVAVMGIGYFVWSQQMGGTPEPGDVVSAGGETESTEDAVADGAVSDAESAAMPEDAERVEVRVATTPPGASVEVAGEASEGQTPFAVSLPIGHEVEVVIRKEGYLTGRLMVTAEANQPAITYELEQLPWVVAVNVTPAEARVVAGGVSPNQLGEITLVREPQGPVSVNATLAGYANATQQVLRTMFTQEGERMLARVDITLEERGRGPRPTGPSMMSMATTDAGDEPEVGGMEPTMVVAMETAMEPAPTMEATMEPAPTMEAIPDNPF